MVRIYGIVIVVTTAVAVVVAAVVAATAAVVCMYLKCVDNAIYLLDTRRYIEDRLT